MRDLGDRPHSRCLGFLCVGLKGVPSHNNHRICHNNHDLGQGLAFPLSQTTVMIRVIPQALSAATLSADEGLIGEPEARALLGGIGRTLFRELADERAIASCKIGRRRLYSKRSVLGYISERLTDT
jgi:hypothetical protein